MLLLLLSCHPDGGKPDTDGLPAPIDLVTPLRADEARAGVVTNADALWDGISAEGAPGDVKLYNDRVRFIVEAVGDGDYYGDDGGALLDADLVRPDGEPGRDLLDEAVVMVGLGRTVRATSVEVVADGLRGGDAVVVVRGVGTPLRLITGALENPDLVADLALDIETTYRLAPRAWTLEVTTRVTNREDDAVLLDIGDVIIDGVFHRDLLSRVIAHVEEAMDAHDWEVIGVATLSNDYGWVEETLRMAADYIAKEGPYRVTSEQIEITPLGSDEDE